MTWLAPWMLAGAALAAGVAIALHFIAWDRPQPAPLPTARFVPEPRFVPAARRRHLADLWLLALRVLAILFAGAAFARPILTPERSGAARIVVVDRSRAVASARDAFDSLRAWRREGDALVVFDSAPRVVDAWTDTVVAPARGSISAALVTAVRQAASRTSARLDSSEIVLISPLLAEEIDAATIAIRNTWPGSVRLVRVAAAVDAAGRNPAPEVRATGDDPVAAAVQLLGPPRARARVVRGALTAADTAFARDGGLVLHWPVVSSGDRGSALIADQSVVVAPFIRPVSQPTGAAVILRWPDGSPAAAEMSLGAGCIRSVEAGVPEGDLALRPRFRDLLGELTSPCRDRVAPATASDSVRAALTASADGGAGSAEVATGLPLAPWLFLAALACALLELVARRPR